jgi:hypothetical protein
MQAFLPLLLLASPLVLLGMATAVSQLLYPEATAPEWHFPQENAALH